jgi:hypothetical protein
MRQAFQLLSLRAVTDNHEPRGRHPLMHDRRSTQERCDTLLGPQASYQAGQRGFGCDPESGTRR